MQDQFTNHIPIILDTKKAKHEFLSFLSMYLLDEKQKNDKKDEALINIGENLLFNLFTSDVVMISKEDFSCLPSSITRLIHNTATLEIHKPFFKRIVNPYTNLMQISY